MKKLALASILGIFISCNSNEEQKSKENELKAFSIPEIGKLDFDKKTKTFRKTLWYNPKYLEILSKAFKPTYKVSEKAKLSFYIEGDLISLSRKNEKELKFTGDLVVIAENGNANTYEIFIEMKGKDVNKTLIPEGYYPTTKYIGVFRTANANKQQLNRVYNDIKWSMDRMSDDLKNALLKHGAKLLVAKDQEELVSNPYFMSLLPMEAIYGNNASSDETLPNAKTDVATAKLELMYLTVYYAFLVEPTLQKEYEALKTAYKEAADTNLFIPGDAYKDDYTDPVHQNASQKNALKYGSFIFNAYRLYFAKAGSISPTEYEYKLGSKTDMQNQNPKAYAFLQKHYDVKKK